MRGQARSRRAVVRRTMSDMIRVAVLDRHPAVRAGLDATLRAQPGMVPVGSAAGTRELFALVYASDPDVLVVDDLSPVRAVKIEDPRVRVVLYAARVTPELVLAAAVAGADGVVDKAADTPALVAALRAVAAGERVLPEVGPVQRTRAARRLDSRDRPIFAMRLAGTAPRDIAAVVGVGIAALNARIAAIVGQLVPATAPA
jgi:DNA-binding NarL/FixJ family response regulator